MSVAMTRILTAIDTISPFVGSTALERRRGRPYRARLGANESLFGASPAALRVMADGASGIDRYTDPTHFELRDAIAAAWGQKIENVIVAEGIDGLLGLFIRAFVEPGDAVVTSLGAYPVVDYHVRGYGGRLVSCPYLPTGSNDLDGLLAAVRESRAKVLFLANPDNPTGHHIHRSELKTFLDHLPDDCLLLLDEAYIEFAAADDILPYGETRQNLVRLRTFSKAFGIAGARIGYALADPAIISALDRIRLHFGVSKLSQDMALAAFQDRAFLAEVVSLNAEGRDHYAAIADQAGVPVLPSSANFVSFDFGDPAAAKAMAVWLEEHDVFVRRPTDPHIDRLVRITVGPRPVRDYLTDVILAGMAALPSALSPPRSVAV